MILSPFKCVRSLNDFQTFGLQTFGCNQVNFTTEIVSKLCTPTSEVAVLFDWNLSCSIGISFFGQVFVWDLLLCKDWAKQWALLWSLRSSRELHRKFHSTHEKKICSSLPKTFESPTKSVRALFLLSELVAARSDCHWLGNSARPSEPAKLCRRAVPRARPLILAQICSLME